MPTASLDTLYITLLYSSLSLKNSLKAFVSWAVSEEPQKAPPGSLRVVRKATGLHLSAMLCYAMLSYAKLCYAMLSYAMLLFSSLFLFKSFSNPFWIFFEGLGFGFHPAAVPRLGLQEPGLKAEARLEEIFKERLQKLKSYEVIWSHCSHKEK